MSVVSKESVAQRLRQEFRSRAAIEVVDVSVRAYPEETNYVVYVQPSDLARAAEVGNELDSLISTDSDPAFVVVRGASKEQVEARVSEPLKTGVKDSRADELIKLISARSRASKAQPALYYIRDVRASVSAVTTGRHHLIFGRRGAGKTALLVEAMRQLDQEGAITCWSNIQALRNESADRVFLYVLEEVLGTVVTRLRSARKATVLSDMANDLYVRVGTLLNAKETDRTDAARLIPRVGQLIRRFLEQDGSRLFIFLDDYYYLPRDEQPRILDMLHSCLRESEAWLKIASIRHLTRWFQTSPPMGLQTVQDANLIDLDVTLQDPLRAKKFLESILSEYARKVGIAHLGGLFNAKALDRLVLASGAVPRDYLVLASDAIVKAQARGSARLVGAQEVNQAAGDAMQVKIQELEEDMAANVEVAERTLEALSIVRRFCLEEENHTYFLIDFRDKEENPAAYSVLTDLMDVRLMHIIDASVSKAHAAGERSEAFMLDLSQYTGSRLKQKIQVLDFKGGSIIARKTRSAEPARVGETPREIIAILRVAPRLDLARLEHLAASNSDADRKVKRS